MSRRALDFDARHALAVSAAFVVACSSCGDHGRVASGPHDYVRCMAVDAPAEGSGHLGPTRWSIADRTLTLRGFTTPLRIAAFRASSMNAPGLRDAVAAVKEQSPGLVFVLGSLGPDEATVRAELDAVSAIDAPVVVIPGGDDEAEIFGDGVDAARAVHANLFDGRRLRAVVAGSDTFLMLGGAPDGRYAATATACGNDDDDRAELDDLGTARRWLVAWAAPSGGGAAAVCRGFEGLDAGDARVAATMTRAHARGGIFAWPETRALLPTDSQGQSVLAPGTPTADLRVVVPHITGPSAERDDYAIGPNGAAILELSSAGLAFTGTTTGGGG